MKYIEFRDSILKELKRNPRGLTWIQLKEKLKLPYSTPCPAWIKRMEMENGLIRIKDKGRALVWNLTNI